MSMVSSKTDQMRWEHLITPMKAETNARGAVIAEPQKLWQPLLSQSHALQGGEAGILISRSSARRTQDFGLAGHLYHWLPF